MSAICGIWHKDKKTVTEDSIGQMLHALNHWQADAIGKVLKSDIALGHLLLHNTPESLREKQPLEDSMSAILLCADLRLDYRDELKGKLEIPRHEDLTDPELLLLAFRKWGKECVRHLFGDFVFAIYDPQQEVLFCARDHIGIKSLVYYNDPLLFAFASEIKALKTLEGVKTQVRDQWVLDYLAHITTDATSTAYENILKLPPAHTLTIAKEGEPQLERYWSLDDVEPVHYNTEEEWAAALEEKMLGAVTERLRSHFPIGSELSSGVDSASIAALGHKIIGNLNTFSNVMDDENMCEVNPFQDERDGIRQIIKHCGIKNHFFVSGIDYPVSQLLKEVTQLFDPPPISFAGIFFDPIYRKAEKQNIRTLLSGAGGDELVTSRGRGYKEHLWDKGEYRALFKTIKAEYPSANPLKKFVAFAVKRNRDLAQFIKSQSTKPLGHYRLQNLRSENVDINKLQQRISHFKHRPAPESVKDYHHQRLDNPMIPIAMENNELLTRSHKMEYRYPMYDIKLISLAYHIPDHLKMKNGQNRYLFRRIMAPYLPKEIIWNFTKHRIYNTPSAYQRIDLDRQAITQLLRGIPEKNKIHQRVKMDKIMDTIQSFDLKLDTYKGAQVNSALQVFFLHSLLKE